MAALKVLVVRIIFLVLLLSAVTACNHVCERVIARGCFTRCRWCEFGGFNGTPRGFAQSLCSFLLRGLPCLARIPPVAVRQEMANGRGLSGELATPLDELDMRADLLVKLFFSSLSSMILLDRV